MRTNNTGVIVRPEGKYYPMPTGLYWVHPSSPFIAPYFVSKVPVETGTVAMEPVRYDVEIIARPEGKYYPLPGGLFWVHPSSPFVAPYFVSQLPVEIGTVAMEPVRLPTPEPTFEPPAVMTGWRYMTAAEENLAIDYALSHGAQTRFRFLTNGKGVIQEGWQLTKSGLVRGTPIELLPPVATVPAKRPVAFKPVSALPPTPTIPAMRPVAFKPVSALPPTPTVPAGRPITIQSPPTATVIQSPTTMNVGPFTCPPLLWKEPMAGVRKNKIAGLLRDNRIVLASQQITADERRVVEQENRQLEQEYRQLVIR